LNVRRGIGGWNKVLLRTSPSQENSIRIDHSEETKKNMLKKTILTILVVLSLLTYKFEVLIPLGFVLVVFYLYKVHKMLLTNKQIIDENTADVNRVITTLLTNQKVLSSDLKSLRNQNHGNKKNVTKEIQKSINRGE
jgi:hypothetical protein